MPAADPGREQVQVARLRQLAAESHLDPAFAEKFLNFIVAEVIHHHERIAGGERCAGCCRVHGRRVPAGPRRPAPARRVRTPRRAAGNATGISVVHGSTATTVAVMDDPSFLALSGDRVYAVSETADGSVSAFRYAGGSLEHRWDADAGGDAPVTCAVDPSARSSSRTTSPAP